MMMMMMMMHDAMPELFRHSSSRTGSYMQVAVQK